MTETDPFESLRHRKQAEEERLHRLAKLGRQWDRTIRNELRRLGQALWPHSHGLRVLPLHHYRLRHHTEAESWSWWIERDVPPRDLYHCEAYRVTLALDGRSEPTLSVQSGAAAYQVAPITMAALEASLAKACADRPLLIPRAMGAATD